MAENELYHYGVKGMKWGQRKALARSAKYAKKIKRGSPHAITGLAFENSGYKKLANQYYKKADKQYQKWEAKKQKADNTAKNYNTTEAQAARKAKMKKAAIAGAAVAGTALAAYGGYKLNKFVRSTNYQYRTQQGKEYAKDLVKQGFVDEIITDKTYSWDATPAYRMAAEAARNTAKSDRLPTAIANTIRYKRLYG